MTTSYSKKLRRARRSETVPVYFGVRRAFDRAIPLQPEHVTLVSVEKSVWEILADGRRVGGVMGSYETIATAARLLARKTGCTLIYESAYAPRTGVEVTILQFRVAKPIFMTDEWVKSLSRSTDEIQLATV